MTENSLRSFLLIPPLYNNIIMKPIENFSFLIKNDACEFDLQQTFNQLSMFALNSPEIPTLPQR